MSDFENEIQEIKEEIANETKEEFVEKKRFRDYLFFFSGQQISILGSSIVSFILIWWITETTQSELMLGIASLVSMGPYLLVVPFSGVIADKVNKKKLLIIVDALQSLFTVILTIFFMIFYDPNSSQYTTFLLTMVFVTSGLRGVMQAFHSPVVSSLVPIMIPKKHLSRMNGVNYLINGIINVIGPALGAVLLSFIGIRISLWIDLATFLIAVIPLILIKIPSVIKEKDTKITFVKDFKEGIDVIRNIKGLFSVIFIATLINFFFAPLGTLLPIFINKVHSGNEGNYALVMGFLQAGVIIGALFMTFFKGFKNKIRTAIMLIIIMFIGQGLLILVPTTLNARFWIIGIILFFTIITNPASNVSFNTSLQLLIPKDKMGRVSSVLSFLAGAITPIGSFLAGVIGEFIPVAYLFTGSSIIGVVIMLSLYYFTPAKNLDSEIKAKMEEQTKLEEEEESSSEAFKDVFDSAEEQIKSPEPFRLEEKIVLPEPNLE
ncbi:MAG: MFS transporter [Candidatus Thorarchaeota archaeon]